MTKYIVHSIVLLLIITCTSCGNKTNNTRATKANPEPAKIIRKHIPYSGEFDQITNMGSINIVFTIGPCNLEVEGTEQLLSLVQADVDCGILMLSLDAERNQDIHKYQTSRTDLTAYISAPSLRMLAIAGSGSFECHQNIVTDFIHIGSMRNGAIHIDSLECRELKYEVNGTAHDSIAHLNCRENTLLLSSGNGYLTAPDANIGGELTLDDNTSSTILVNGKTSTLVINNQGTGLSQFTGSYTKKTIYQGDKARVVVKP